MATYKVVRVDRFGIVTEILSIDLPEGERLLSYEALPKSVGNYATANAVADEHYVGLDREKAE
jgi:hypothetical protein